MTAHRGQQHPASNPIVSALHKFNKKKEKQSFTSNATNSFFSRSKPNNNPAMPSAPVPGSVRQVSAAQLPPIWVNPPTAPPRSASPKAEKDEVVEQVSEILSHVTTTPDPASSPKPAKQSTSRSASTYRFRQFQTLLQTDVVDLDKLKQLSWSGIPPAHRPCAWKLLLGYMPLKQGRRGEMMERKRQEYQNLLGQFYYIADGDRGSKEQATLRQILVDIPRTNADVPLFQHHRVQQAMERVLYIWAMRHPASGYVQGINDLLTPFFIVFLSEFIDAPATCDASGITDATLAMVEADSYWCLTKLLDEIQDHYTFAQPGLQRMVQKMEGLIHRCDAELFNHVAEEGVQFVQFAFRWMNCLLMREVPLDASIRLWDTYLSEDNGFESFHVYVCAAILLTFGEQVKQLEFQDLVMFLQSLPTTHWVEDDINPLLSRAFILQSYFADAPNHLS